MSTPDSIKLFQTALAYQKILMVILKIKCLVPARTSDTVSLRSKSHSASGEKQSVSSTDNASYSIHVVMI